MMVCLYGAILIQIVIHEAGHLVFGLLTGYRFCSMLQSSIAKYSSQVVGAR